jgi:hypothetical protein
MVKEMTAAKVMQKFIQWVTCGENNHTPEELMNVAIVAIGRIDVAIKSANFLQSRNSGAFEKMISAQIQLQKIADYLKKGLKYKENAEAVLVVYEAMKILREDNIIQNDPETAAKAFDMLFIGFGTLAKNFPPPFDKTIGEFLCQCGQLSFFSNMQKTMAGPNSNLGYAKYLRDNLGKD